jgi:hypothetical protein
MEKGALFVPIAIDMTRNNFLSLFVGITKWAVRWYRQM